METYQNNYRSEDTKMTNHILNQFSVSTVAAQLLSRSDFAAVSTKGLRAYCPDCGGVIVGDRCPCEDWKLSTWYLGTI